MQHSRNTARRMLEYQNRIHAAAVSANAGNPYKNPMMYANAKVPQNERDTTNTSFGSLSNMPLSLAMAYVPFQDFVDLYEPDEALSQGTLFRELDKPFYGQRRRMG